MEKIINSRTQQAMSTKSKIFERAIILINQKGYDNVRVQDICSEAGISIGAFYHHFKNKESIITESFKKIDELFEKNLGNIMKNKGAPERILSFFLLFSGFVNYMGLDFTSQLVKSEVTSDYRLTSNLQRPIAHTLKNIVLEGQSSGQIRNDMPAERIVRELLRLARGIVFHWCVNKGEYSLEKEIDEALRMYLQCYMTSYINT